MKGGQYARVDMKETTMVEFEKTYVEYRENIFRVCAMMLKDYQLAEDATQETFYKALCKLHSFNKSSSAKTWLTRIAINICKDRLRKKSSFETPKEDVDVLSHTYSEENIDSKLSVIEAIKALPVELREVVVLYYYQELTHKEISKILKLSVPNVAYRLRTAKSKLKDYLTEDNNE